MGTIGIGIRRRLSAELGQASKERPKPRRFGAWLWPLRAFFIRRLTQICADFGELGATVSPERPDGSRIGLARPPAASDPFRLHADY